MVCARARVYVCVCVSARTSIPLCELLHSAEADVFISRGSAAETQGLATKKRKERKEKDTQGKKKPTDIEIHTHCQAFTHTLRFLSNHPL